MRLFPLPALLLTLACNDSGTGPAARNVASVDVTLESTEIEMGQHVTATAVARDQFGAPIDAGSVSWSSTFPVVAVVNAATGEIVGNSSGNAEIVATVAGQTGRQRITVSPPPLLINEVFPNGDLPGGWVEVFNPTAEAVDLSGWTVTGGDITRAFTFPAGLVIESGGYAAVNEVTLPVELGVTDAVHLFNKYGVQADQFTWTGNQVGTAYARCPDGLGAFVTTQTPTRKAINTCP